MTLLDALDMAVRQLRRSRADVIRLAVEHYLEDFDRLAETSHFGADLKGDLRGLRRLRVGDHRVVYEVRDDELIVLAIRIVHRRDADRRPPAWNLTDAMLDRIARHVHVLEADGESHRLKRGRSRRQLSE